MGLDHRKSGHLRLREPDEAPTYFYLHVGPFKLHSVLGN